MIILHPIVVGVLGFLILYLVDYFDLRKKRIFKTITWLVGFSILLVSHIQVIFKTESYIFSNSLRVVGVVLSIIFFNLLLYSVFVEIPILRKRGFTINKKGLIVDGTYALSRHPGISWYILTLISLFLFSGSKSLLVAIPLWVLTDILYAVVQDKFLFPKLFGEDYNYYKIKTPMFIPNLQGIKSCISTYGKLLNARSEKAA